VEIVSCGIGMSDPRFLRDRHSCERRWDFECRFVSWWGEFSRQGFARLSKWR
jgi:hypothetical protein